MIPHLDMLEHPRDRVRLALTDPIYGSATDGEIAEVCDATRGTVRSVRRELAESEPVRAVLEQARAQKHAEGLGHMSTLEYLTVLLRDRQRNATASVRPSEASDSAAGRSRRPQPAAPDSARHRRRDAQDSTLAQCVKTERGPSVGIEGGGYRKASLGESRRVTGRPG